MSPRREPRTAMQKRHEKLDEFIELAGAEANALLKTMVYSGYYLMPSDGLLERDGSINLESQSSILAFNYDLGIYQNLRPTQNFGYSMGVKLQGETLHFTHRSIHSWRLKLRDEGFDIPEEPVARRQLRR